MRFPVTPITKERHLFVRVLILSLISALFTIWILRFSWQHDRLMSVPTYDDIFYFNDGVDRLEQYYQHGWTGLLRSWWHHPPHSPFSTILAFFSLALFGIEDWAPYAGNAVVVFVLLGFTDRLLRGSRPWVTVLGLSLVLALPMTQRAITEFRPDFFTALLTVMGCVYLINSPLVIARPTSGFISGVLFGLALLAKPTMCLFVSVMFVGSLALAMFRDWLEYRPTFPKLLKTYSVVILASVLMATPYYVLIWDHVNTYVFSHIFGQYADIWIYAGSRSESLLYYLKGVGIIVMLDQYRYLIAAIFVIGVAYALAARLKTHLIRLVSLALLMVIAWAIPTFIGVKQFLFGSTLYLLLVSSALLSLRVIFLEPLPRFVWGRPAACLLLSGAALMTLVRSPQVPILGTRGDAKRETINQVCGEILSTVLEHRIEGNQRIFVTKESDPINFDVLQWVTHKQGLAFQFAKPHYWRDLEQYRQEMEKANFILAFDTDTPMPHFPSDELASQTLALARSLKDLDELRSFPSYDGTIYYLFGNNPFRGWETCEGLRHPEGPYPQWNLPVVRWGTGPQTRLVFRNKETTSLELSLSCRTSIDRLSIRIILDNQLIDERALYKSEQFTELNTPLHISPGNHELILQYDCKSDKKSLSAHELTVLYKRLLIKREKRGQV